MGQLLARHLAAISEGDELCFEVDVRQPEVLSLLAALRVDLEDGLTVLRTKIKARVVGLGPSAAEAACKPQLAASQPGAALKLSRAVAGGRSLHLLHSGLR